MLAIVMQTSSSPRGDAPAGIRSYLVAILVVALCTAIGFTARPLLAEADLGMAMLLGVVIVAYREPLVPALVAVALSVAAFDFFFIPPFYTFDVAHMKYLVTFAVMSVVGVTVSSLAARVRERDRAANEARLMAEAEQVRNALLSSVSHDLRTPLGSIIGSASALRQHTLDEHNRGELLDTIQEEAAHLKQLLDNLLQMTRVAGGAPAINKEWHVPEEIVGAAIHHLEPRIASHRVEVRIAPQVGLACFDGLLIEQALANLLDNSIKYSPPGSRIDIDIRVDEGELVWEVRDQGVGLAPGIAERVFDKFYRGPGRRERGSGLGLAIVKAIAEAHGGRVWASSLPGLPGLLGATGAVVGFALPLVADAPALPAEEDA
jgi:two-component system, OmpR family, sensor histidine kinase KdpD